MKSSKRMGVAAAVLFTALWSLPLTRAVLFYHWAHRYFRETNSLNAANDLRFSRSLLVGYGTSWLAALFVAWLLSRRPCARILVPALLLGFAAGEVIYLHPESPIHLSPTMQPWRPALIGLVAVVLAVRGGSKAAGDSGQGAESLAASESARRK